MLRSILGFALLAIVAIVITWFAFWLLGLAFGAAKFLLNVALIGLVVYWVLKLIAPSTARRVREMIAREKPVE